jgi:uncharacterized protein (DUF1501 family)
LCGFGGYYRIFCFVQADSTICQTQSGKKKILVCIFQRGAMDGLMAVTPFADSYLRSLRPGLFMSPEQKEGEYLI